MDNLGKKPLIYLAFPLAEDVFPKLATKAISSILDKVKRKISGQGVVRAKKWFTLFIFMPIDDMDHFISRITIKFRPINWCCYWNSKIWNKKTRRWISSCYDGIYDSLIDSTYWMASSLIQLITPSLINPM